MRAAPIRARAYSTSCMECRAYEPWTEALDLDGESRMPFSLWAKRRVLATLCVFSIMLGPALAPSVVAKTLRFAFQGELKSVDPYQINESFSESVNMSVYEGLVRRG